MIFIYKNVKCIEKLFNFTHINPFFKKSGTWNKNVSEK